VAEDTKEQFFNSSKSRLNSCKINSLTYSDNFTKAVVRLISARTVNIEGNNIEMPIPSVTMWKIEDGKWVWYEEPTGIGIIRQDLAPGMPRLGALVNPPANGPAPQAPKPITDSDIQAAVRTAFAPASVDKDEVTLAANIASQSRVVFHNSTSGPAELQFSVTPELSGFTVKADKSQANILEEVGIVFRYDPGDSKKPATPVTVQLTILPSNQTFKINVKFVQ
jgi:hypothetical protein